MKILYAVQGTGNGHLMRATELIPAFREIPGVVMDVLVSGTQHELKLPFDVKYQSQGLSFVFGKSGGIDYAKTFRKLNALRFVRDVKNLPVQQYDLVISDFEPVSVRAARWRRVPCIALSNQAAVLHPLAPRTQGLDMASRLLLKHYAPGHQSLGFHYQSLDETVFTPIIRQAVRQLKTSRAGHYCVYLPAYSDENIVKTLRQLPERSWHVYSKRAKRTAQHGTIQIHPLEEMRFLESLAHSDGVVCNAGFGTTTEALFLGKKMLVVPMKRQCEQQCNAAMLAAMGVQVFGTFLPGNAASIEKWLHTGHPVKVNYPDNLSEVVATVLKTYESMVSQTDELTRNRWRNEAPGWPLNAAGLPEQ